MQNFPVRLPTLWRQAFPGLMSGALASRVWTWLQGEAFSWPQTLPLMLAAAVLVVALHLLLPTRAGPEGLMLGTYWGWRRRVGWEDIADVQHTRLFPLQLGMKLRDRQGRAYWISRDTQDLAGLHALALSRGGPGHPLTQALEMPMYRL